jgi:glutamine synthetase type III
MIEIYYELPFIFKLVVDAFAVMLILMFIISGIYYLPKKNREMKTEQLDLERDIAKKKVVLTNQLQEYASLVERTAKEKAKAAEEYAKLQKDNEDLKTENKKLEEANKKLEKKVGGRPKKTT